CCCGPVAHEAKNNKPQIAPKTLKRALNFTTQTLANPRPLRNGFSTRRFVCVQDGSAIRARFPNSTEAALPRVGPPEVARGLGRRLFDRFDIRPQSRQLAL